MAHVRRLPARRWQARYRDPAGRERARNFSRKADAEKWLTTVEAAKLRGEWVDPVLARMSVGVWALEVEASRPNRRPTTMARDEASLRNHILPAFGDVELRGVQPLDYSSGSLTWKERGWRRRRFTRRIRYSLECLRLLLWTAG